MSKRVVDYIGTRNSQQFTMSFARENDRNKLAASELNSRRGWRTNAVGYFSKNKAICQYLFQLCTTFYALLVLN